MRESLSCWPPPFYRYHSSWRWFKCAVLWAIPALWPRRLSSLSSSAQSLACLLPLLIFAHLRHKSPHF